MKFTITKTFTLLIASLFCIGQAKGQSITVNTTDYQQTIDMMGGDMERSSMAIQSAENKDEILEWTFGDIDFNVCRVQYDKNQELTEGTKNWEFYDKQVATMQDIKAINPDIKFFATMRSDYDGYGDDNNLPDWIIDYDTRVMERTKYGIFLADYVEYMSEQGVPITYISTAKEWLWFVRAAKAVDIIAAMGSALTQRGIDMPLISDQGFWSLSQGITYLNSVESLGSKDLYHSFCSHNYDSEDADTWVELIDMSVDLGKPMYDDETSTGSGSPTYGVERDIWKQIDEYKKKSIRYESGLSGEIFFEIWSRGIDKETRSIYFPSGGTGERKRGYYLMKHFSNHVLDSKYVTAETSSLSDVYTIQFRKDDEVVLWVMNEGSAEHSLVSISVDAFTITDSVNMHTWTDSLSIEGSESNFIANGNMFETGLPGECIKCFIFNVKDTADNLALNGTATQSSTLDTAEASLAIDGNTDGMLANGSVTQTTVEDNAWWQVNIGTNDTIGIINLYNRTDECCTENLSNFTVSVIDDNDSTTFSQTITSAPDSSISIDTEGVLGQIVKIQLNESNSLSLAEVQVYQGTIYEKHDHYINFPAFETISYTTESFSPGASCSSDLGVDYSSSNTGVAAIEDGEIQIYSVGSAVITASRSETDTYNAAEDVSQTLTIIKADQEITFDALDSTTYGDPSFLIYATASSGLDVEFSSSTPSVATVEDSRITLVAEGSTTIIASQAGNDNYNAANDVSQTLIVESGTDENTDTNILNLSPTDDTFIRGGDYDDDNYNSETYILTKQTSNTTYHRKSLLQFDVYDVETISSATLRLYCTTGKESTIVIYATTDDWDESSVTYNSAPSEGDALASQEIADANVYYEWDVSEYIEQEMAGDDIASFIVADISSTKNSNSFNSKEASDNLPELVIIKTATSTSINSINLEDKSSVSISPNPASNYLNVKSTSNMKNILITNILGQTIAQFNAIGKKEITVEINNYNTGVYLLQISDEDGNNNTYKVLVEK